MLWQIQHSNELIANIFDRKVYVGFDQEHSRFVGFTSERTELEEKKQQQQKNEKKMWQNKRKTETKLAKKMWLEKPQ